MELLTINNVWMMIATFLVFVMHLGFASLESGLTQAKNTTNILFKNLFVICMGILTYYAVGFELMYDGGLAIMNNEAGNDAALAYADGAYTYHTDFLFQAMFAATTATIISGAVAERIKLSAFMVISTLFVAFAYPFMGEWKWGGGWLDALGFYDFAGSTIVHAVGGTAALVGAWMLGPRIGKYSIVRDARQRHVTKTTVNAIPASNLSLAMIGGMLLWLGWFGFNGGSVLSADPVLTSWVLVTTCLSAAAGGIGAMVSSMLMNNNNRLDFTMMLNGILAGLVGITAGADVLTPLQSILTGLIAGTIVVASVITLDQYLKIDDPVGAISVHLTCGIWGTLAVGIFSPDHSVLTQSIGIVAYVLGAVLSAGVLFGATKAVMGIRVSEEEESIGLDMAEHGISAYSKEALDAA